MHESSMQSGQDQFGRWSEFTVNGATQRMRWIPPGQFMMGSPEDEEGRFREEGPQHLVTFQKGFWLADTPCTQSLWQAVMGENPSFFRRDGRFNGDERPVEQVSLIDVQEFINRLNNLVPDGGFRLPSEAEWEYACRAGTETRYWFCDDIFRDLANFNFIGTTLVKCFPPNSWGLFDMHGNVWEWCQDDFHGNYDGAPTDGSAWDGLIKNDGGLIAPKHGSSDDLYHVKGIHTSSLLKGRIVRGGSWCSSSEMLRSAKRLTFQPDEANFYIGFRLAKTEG